MRSSSVLKVVTFIMAFSVAGMFWKFYFDESKKLTGNTYLYNSATHTPVGFDSNLSRAYTLRKIANITVRNVNTDWQYVDDVCYTGVVFPSFHLTTALANATLYVHNGRELHSTLEQLKPGSMLRRNLGQLLEGINRLENASFIDIYAGSGIYSLPVARLGRNVIAVEYRYTYAERLCRGVMAGQLQGRVTILNNMLSNVTQVLPLPYHHHGNKALRDVNATDDVFTHVTSVELDSLLERFTLQEAVLRIDMDPDVIHSVLRSHTFFENVEIPFILMEWTGHIMTEYKDKLSSFFAKYDLFPCKNPTCMYQLQDNTTELPTSIWWANMRLNAR